MGVENVTKSGFNFYLVPERKPLIFQVSDNIINDVQAGNTVNSWDIANLSVGAVGIGATILLVSNPVEWMITGTTIYFGARFVYNI